MPRLRLLIQTGLDLVSRLNEQEEHINEPGLRTMAFIRRVTATEKDAWYHNCFMALEQIFGPESVLITRLRETLRLIDDMHNRSRRSDYARMEAERIAYAVAIIKEYEPFEMDAEKTKQAPSNREILSKAAKITESNYPEVQRSLNMLEDNEIPESKSSQDEKRNRLRSLIVEIKQQIKADNEESIQDIFRKIEPKISQIYQMKEYRDLIGARKSDDLSRLVANEYGNVEELRNAVNLGIPRREEEALRKLKHTFDRIVMQLNDIEFSLT